MARAYSADEMRRYWRTHSRLWADLDRVKDPEGLTNVCYNGAPLWLNRFASSCQHRTFRELLTGIGGIAGRHVLDIGCGVGRWSSLMSGLGGDVTGIDLQAETLADNRRRFPVCRFIEMSADSLAFPRGVFDIAVSVTVIQHMPEETQEAAFAEIRRVMKTGGCFVLLEGTRDRGPHVFSRSANEWIGLARRSGFEAERVTHYDHSPLIYGLRRLAGALRAGSDGEGGTFLPVEEYVKRFRSSPMAGGLARRGYRMALRAATIASYPLEPIFMAIGSARTAHHVGILLRAR